MQTGAVQQSGSTDRGARRKQRTRAALIAAAQEFLAQGRDHAPIQQITEAADVGLGSFYNHFASREELYAAAIADALDQHGALLESVLADETDPAVVFATSFRVTGRLHQVQPQLARLVRELGVDLLTASDGLGPRARRDLLFAHEAGRLQIPDIDVAMVHVIGAATALGQVVANRSEADTERIVDSVTEGLLRLLGMSEAEATRLCTLPLPTFEP